MGNSHLGGCRSNNGTWVPAIWDRLIEMYGIKSVIDVGCGYAQSLHYFIEKGIVGRGIEGWAFAVKRSHSKQFVILHDYTLGTYEPECDFDLAWCAEFVEHVESKFIDNFMATFKKCKYVAMTHAYPKQRGYHHVNCQNPQYWIDVFKKNKFDYLENDSLDLRKLTFSPDGTPKKKGGHVRRSLMVFKRNL